MLNVTKFAAIKPRSISASRSKSGGSFQLVPGNPLPKIEWSQLVSGVEQLTEVATLQGLELVITPQHKQNWIKLKHQNEVTITTDKIATWLGKQTEKYSLAYLADNGLLSSLEDAAKDYFKNLVTTATIDLEDTTTLKDLALSTMLQCSRQAALCGTNAKFSKLVSEIPEEMQSRLETKLLEAIAELKLLPGNDNQPNVASLPIWEGEQPPTLEQPIVDETTLKAPTTVKAKKTTKAKAPKTEEAIA
jgi:hypothetical protein